MYFYIKCTFWNRASSKVTIKRFHRIYFIPRINRGQLNLIKTKGERAIGGIEVSDLFVRSEYFLSIISNCGLLLLSCGLHGNSGVRLYDSPLASDMT